MAGYRQHNGDITFDGPGRKRKMDNSLGFEDDELQQISSILDKVSQLPEIASKVDRMQTMLEHLQRQQGHIIGSLNTIAERLSIPQNERVKQEVVLPQTFPMQTRKQVDISGIPQQNDSKLDDTGSSRTRSVEDQFLLNKAGSSLLQRSNEPEINKDIVSEDQTQRQNKVHGLSNTWTSERNVKPVKEELQVEIPETEPVLQRIEQVKPFVNNTQNSSQSPKQSASVSPVPARPVQDQTRPKPEKRSPKPAGETPVVSEQVPQHRSWSPSLKGTEQDQQFPSNSSEDTEETRTSVTSSSASAQNKSSTEDTPDRIPDDKDIFRRLKRRHTDRHNDNRISFLYSDVNITGEMNSHKEEGKSFTDSGVLREKAQTDRREIDRVEVEDISDDSDAEPSGVRVVSSLKPEPLQLNRREQQGASSQRDTSITSSLEEDGRPEGPADLKVLQESDLEELTLKEANRAADCTDPKSQGADTILCIDTSESMRGKPFEQIKTFVDSFLEGIEELAVEHSLEENLALVTFGKETRVIQNLTNDYGKIREALDTLEIGGPSPIMTGLVLCLSAIYNRGGVVTFRERKIHPRIILLSDGRITDQRIFNGPDVIVKQGGTKKEIWHKLMEFAERFRTHHDPRHLVCVPVGDADMDLLGQLVNTAGGTVVSADQVNRISHHFLINTVVAKVIHDGVLRGQLPADDDLRRKIKETEGAGQFNDMEIDDALVMIKKESEMVASQRGATGGRDESLTTETKEMPPIGTRVRRGPDWRWDNQDDNLAGTVIAHKARGYLTVEWDNGNKGKYRYGAESGAKDVRMVDEPRILPPGMMAAVGCRAKRGADWEWGSQDGGEGSTGVIFKVEDSGVIHVRWDNGKRGNYRFGLFGKFDVEICSQSLGVEGATGTTSVDDFQTAEQSKQGQWQWQDKEGRWRDHYKAISERIEHFYQTRDGKGTVLVESDGDKFRVIPEKKCQRSMATGVEYPIRRIEVTVT